jgi:hypothetical protein
LAKQKNNDIVAISLLGHFLMLPPPPPHLLGWCRESLYVLSFLSGQKNSTTPYFTQPIHRAAAGGWQQEISRQFPFSRPLAAIHHHHFVLFYRPLGRRQQLSLLRLHRSAAGGNIRRTAMAMAISEIGKKFFSLFFIRR